MADYTINFTDTSKTPITITDNSVNGPDGGFDGRATDLNLMGDGYLNWGPFIDENYLHLLENFACPSDLHTITAVAANSVTVSGDKTASFAKQQILEIDSMQINAVVLTGGATFNYFSVPGDFTSVFTASSTFVVSGSTSNNGTYTVALTGPTLVGTNTIIPVNEVIPSNSPNYGYINAGNYFKFSGNYVTTYTPGYVFSVYDGSTVKVYTVSSSFYAAPDTFVTVVETVTETAGTGLTGVYVVTIFEIVDSPQASGYQIVDTGSNHTGSDATGLANDTTVYTATITIDGTGYPVSATGSSNQTYTQLLATINTAISSPTNGTADFNTAGNIQVTSTSTGSTSTVAIVDGGTALFASLTGFVAIDTAVDGTDGNNGYYTASAVQYTNPNTVVTTIENIPHLTPTALGEAGNSGRPDQNLANSPKTPIQGQTWYNTTTSVLHTYDGTKWTTVNTGFSAASIIGSPGLTAIGSPITAGGNLTLTLSAQLQAFNGIGTNGFVARTSSTTASARTITGSTNLVVTNGDGVSGDPTLTLTTGALTESTSSVLTITGGSTAVLGTGTTIQVKQATTSQSGYLSSTDWNTFNNKQNALSYPLAQTLGGTGNTSYSDGQLLIGNSTSSSLSKATLTAGSGITVTNGHGSITVSAVAGGYSSSTSPVSNTLALRDAFGRVLSVIGASPPISGVEYCATFGDLYDTMIGWGQVWASYSGSRAASVVYSNNTARPIMVSIGVQQPTSGNGNLVAYCDSTASPTVVVGDQLNGAATWLSVSFIVPKNHYYKVAITGTIAFWAELR